MGNLRQHAAAIAQRLIRAGGTAMIQVDENLQPLLQNRMAFAIVEVRHKADSAGIMLVRRVIKPLRLGQKRVPNDHVSTPLRRLAGEIGQHGCPIA